MQKLGNRNILHQSESNEFGDSEGIREENTASFEVPVEKEMEVSTSLQIQEKELDPLITSLTSPGPPGSEDTKVANIPLLGEVPIDGSILVLAPASTIAIIGFFYSFVVAFNAKDEFIDTLASINPPPPKETILKNDGTSCRGICSSQEEDLKICVG